MEKLRVNHAWGKAIIAAVKDEQGIYAAADLNAFIKRLTKVAIDHAGLAFNAESTKKLTWSFKQDTINQIVMDIMSGCLENSVIIAVNQVIQELKDETVRVA